ncbi:MAG: hypothetical protein WC905_01160 [Patescibacteria group bacterium]|jgi:hypothetical protein
MVKHYPLTYSGRIIVQILGKILYFPVWWYTVGLVRLVKNAWQFLRNQEQSLSLVVWIKNLFVPMYGQRDWAGRLISFLIRSVQIIARGLIMILWLAIATIVLCFWLAVPALLVIALGFQLVK